MLSREDFVFTIGYDGPSAVVDNKAKRKYGKLSTLELVEKGLFRAAYSSAVHAGDQEEIKLVANAYNQLVGHSPSPVQISDSALSEADKAALARLFGVFPVEVKRSVSI